MLAARSLRFLAHDGNLKFRKKQQKEFISRFKVIKLLCTCKCIILFAMLAINSWFTACPQWYIEGQLAVSQT